jgi:hypothetical protein
LIISPPLIGFALATQGVGKGWFWRFCLQVYARRKRLFIVASTQAQAAKTTKVHFKPQNADTAIRIDYQCL